MNYKQIAVGRDITKSIILEAQQNSEFKNQLIESPEESLKQFLGPEKYVPIGKKIVVENQMDDSIIYFNLIAEPNLDDIELTEEQLETIAGGTTTPVCLAVGYYALVSSWGCAAVVVAGAGYVIGRFT